MIYKKRKSLSEHNRYLIWVSTRSVMETENHKHKREGTRLSFYAVFIWLIYTFEGVLKLCGVHRLGMRNARRIKSVVKTVPIHQLPASLGGFKILHISDMHIDAITNFEDDIVAALPQYEVDLCVITGDFRMQNHGPYKHLIPKIRKVVDHIQSKHGVVAVLGNHDPFQLVQWEEELHVKFLINESVTIECGGETLTVTGTDDPYRYYTDQAMEALTARQEGVKIAAVHTAELAPMAQENGYSLYLCGHTHGGQVCLPGGKPIITHQSLDPNMARGEWQLGQMQGYTSVGCGVSGIPVRYFCPAEVTIHVLENLEM